MPGMTDDSVSTAEIFFGGKLLLRTPTSDSCAAVSVYSPFAAYVPSMSPTCIFWYHKIIQSGPKKCIHSLLINIFGINLNEIEISFKFIPKILMSKECIHFFGPLCISGLSDK